MERTLKELEVDRFIRTQKKVRVALNVLFTKLERLLIRNQKCFVLNSDKVNMNSSSQSDFELDESNVYDENPHLQ